MTWWKRLFSSRELERELEAELRYHFERRVTEHMADGESEAEARREDVLRLVMGESMILVAAGVAISLGGAIALSRLVSGLLFGVASTDPVTTAGAIAVLVGVSAVAGYLPARRASLVDPMVALRNE
jgi:hypothetical protein